MSRMTYETLVPILDLWIEYEASIPSPDKPGTLLLDEYGTILNVAPTIEGFMEWLKTKIKDGVIE